MKENKIFRGRCLRATLLMLACLVAGTAGADTGGIKVLVEQKLSTDHWYPLPEEQMKAAALDTALSVLTDSRRLYFVSAGGPDVGQLIAELSLLGPAETVKFTLTLNAADVPSLVSTASISISHLEYAGIYQAFEYVGREAALRMEDRLAVTLVSPPKQGGDDAAIAEMYNKGMELKRAGEFESARKTFTRLAATASPAQAKWKEMAEDELKYGLLMFEARRMLVEFGDPAVDLNRKAELGALAANRAREVIAANQTHAERVSEAQKFLDEMDVINRSLVNIKKAAVIGNATGLKAMLAEAYMDMGECPDETMLKSMLRGSNTRNRFVGITGDPSNRTYRFEDTDMKSEFRLQCAKGTITLEQ
ncbi:MAG TPA: hypothetical protein VFX02_12700 [Gammaproteobacteria bacterium]|nr:hypothetical protein [Gammaproteobacteria bacterium]